MAAHMNTPHLDEEDIGDEDSLTEDEDANSASTSSSLPTPTAVVTTTTPTSSSAHFVTVAVPSVPNASTSPDNQIIALPAAGDRKPFQDDSRKLFQRLWTDEDEMELLRGFSDYTSQRGGTVHWDANLFYDQIRSKLRLEFNKSQLVEKLRRLKKKYKNAVSKISDGKDVAFKSAHDRATFEISGKIWSNIAALVVNGDNMDEDDDEDGNAHHDSSIPMKTPNPNLIPNHNLEPKTEDATFRSRKRQRLPYQSTPENNVNPSSNLVALTEEIVKSSLTPFIKELKNRSHGGGIGGFASAAPFGAEVLEMFDFGMGIGIVGDLKDERWSKQQMLELEVYSKRLDLMQGQIRAKLKELRSNSRR